MQACQVDGRLSWRLGNEEALRVQPGHVIAKYIPKTQTAKVKYQTMMDAGLTLALREAA